MSDLQPRLSIRKHWLHRIWHKPSSTNASARTFLHLEAKKDSIQQQQQTNPQSAVRCIEEGEGKIYPPLKRGIDSRPTVPAVQIRTLRTVRTSLESWSLYLMLPTRQKAIRVDHQHAEKSIIKDVTGCQHQTKTSVAPLPVIIISSAYESSDYVPV